MKEKKSREAKELALARLEFTEFGVLDRCVHVVAAEQTSFFKTVFTVEELLDASLYKNKQCQSVLKKNTESLKEIKITQAFCTEENRLIRLLIRFPEIVDSAATHYSPHFIATYAYEVAHIFNLFYEKCPILQAENKERKIRLALTRATSHILHNTLSLLGIQTIDTP